MRVCGVRAVIFRSSARRRPGIRGQCRCWFLSAVVPPHRSRPPGRVREKGESVSRSAIKGRREQAFRPIDTLPMSAPILLADKNLRTKTLRWAALLAILGLTGIWSLIVYLDELTALQAVNPQPTAEKYSRLLFFFGVANMLIASGVGGTLGFIFYKALRAEQFPPPGIKLMWDTKLRTGKEARRIAIACVAIAMVLILCGISLGVVMSLIARAPILLGPFLKASLFSGGYSFS